MSHIMPCLSKAPNNVLWLMEAQHYCCWSCTVLKHCSLFESVTVWPHADLSPARVDPVRSLPMGTNSVQTLYLPPGNQVGNTTTLSQGKDLDLREVMSPGKVSSCRKDSAGVCGQSQSWEVASSGLFTADASPLDNGMCVQVGVGSQPWMWWVPWIQDFVQTIVVWLRYVEYSPTEDWQKP